MLYRDELGYTQARRVADMPRATKMFEAGGQLGHLWMEGFFDVGDPLVSSGGPVTDLRSDSADGRRSEALSRR